MPARQYDQRLGKIRKEIKLTKEEVQAAEAAAKSDGFAFNRWVVALIRARIGKGAQLGQFELEMLARSNMQILALGRNINQIARMLHSNPGRVHEAKLVELANVRAAIKDHSAMVVALMEANIQRWRSK